MAITRVNFLAYVKRTFKRTDKDTELYEFLDETIKDIATRHSFQVLQYQSYVPIVAEQEDYPLPTDLMHLHHPIRILEGLTTNDDGWALERLTKDSYDYYEPNPNRANPQTGETWGYCIYNNEILLTNIPGTAQSGHLIEINWSKQPTLPTADGDNAHPYGNPWDETVKWGVLGRAYESMEMYQESDRFNGYYEVGKPINIGGRVQGFQGGIANMIQVDQRQTSAPLQIVNNSL